MDGIPDVLSGCAGCHTVGELYVWPKRSDEATDDLLGGALRSIAKQDSKFVAAESRCHVCGSAGSRYRAGESADLSVPGSVPK